MVALNTYLKIKEHGHERPEFIKYDYLRKRDKRFPWGDGQKSFFHVSKGRIEVSVNSNITNEFVANRVRIAHFAQNYSIQAVSY